MAKGEDRICLNNMVFYGYHGAYAAEKELGQRLEVDLEIHKDLGPAGQADDLELTANYVDVYAIVKDIVEEREFNLMEAIAETIASEVLSASGAEAVVVRVRKPHPPIGGVIDSTGVEVTRRRAG